MSINISSLSSLYAYGSSAGAAAKRAGYLVKLNGITSEAGTESSKSSAASGATTAATATGANNLNKVLSGYQSDIKEAQATADSLLLSNEDSLLHQVQYETDEELNVTMNTDDIVSAMQSLVDGYNQAVTEGSKLGTASYASMPAISDSDLSTSGISVNPDGTLKLDQESLSASLSTDLKGTSSVIGGKYGVAAMLSQSITNKTNDNMAITIENALQGSSTTTTSEDSDTDISSILSSNSSLQSTFAALYTVNKTGYSSVGTLLDSLA